MSCSLVYEQAAVRTEILGPPAHDRKVSVVVFPGSWSNRTEPPRSGRPTYDRGLEFGQLDGVEGMAQEAGRPLLRVVRGSPTATELAALVAVLATRARQQAAARAAGDRQAPLSAWTDRTRLLRRPLQPGPDAWRASGWPG